MFIQREIGIDTPNFRKAPRAVLRQNPGIIVVGEMPEAGALDSAMSTAETGHRGLRPFTRPACGRFILSLRENFLTEKHELGRLKISESIQCVIVQKYFLRLNMIGAFPCKKSWWRNRLFAARSRRENLIRSKHF